MGIRIDAFAIDTPRFLRVLELPLWQVLSQLSRRAPRDHFMFSVFEPEVWRNYAICPDGRVVRATRNGPTKSLLTEELAATPFLQQPYGAYLRNERTSSGALHFLLFDWQVVESEVIHTITEGHRRWWIGSVLSAAARVEFPMPQYRELSALLARMLAGWDCGVQLPSIENHPRVHDFPASPSDPDNRMAVLSADECHALVDLFELLLKGNPVFESSFPLQPDDFDWDPYVGR